MVGPDVGVPAHPHTGDLSGSHEKCGIAAPLTALVGLPEMNWGEHTLDQTTPTSGGGWRENPFLGALLHSRSTFRNNSKS